MLEIMKPVSVKKNKPHISAIHGHTIIELKNVKTGIRDRIESDNVVTDAAEDFVDKFYYNAALGFSSLTDMAQAYFGGMYMFDKTIATTAKYKPEGVRQVGGGIYNYSSNTTQSVIGLYNGNDSSKTADSFTQVYDFLTNQANGTIKSVCLGSYYGASCGYGWDERLSAGSATLTGGSFIYIPDVNTTQRVRMIINDDDAYIPSWNSDRADTIIPANYGIYDLLHYNLHRFDIPKFTSVLNQNNAIELNPIRFTFTPVNMELIVFPSYNSLKFYAVPTSATTSPVILEFDIENETITAHSFTTDKSFRYIIQTISKDGNYIYGSYSRKIYKININTGAYIETTIPTSKNDNSLATMRHITEDDIYACAYHTTNVSMIYDSSLNECKEFMGDLTYSSGGYYGSSRDAYYSLITDCIYSYTSSDSGSIRVQPNPMRLTTINNLSETVIKTAADTMKVTYTLTME